MCFLCFPVTHPPAPHKYRQTLIGVQGRWHIRLSTKASRPGVYKVRSAIVSQWIWILILLTYLLLGHSVYFNTAVTSPEILGKLRFWTKKRARSISYDHIKMMQSMVYLISLFTLILIKWHVTSPEISGLVTSPVMTWYWGNLNKIWYWGILHT